jgi:3' terminal RNA ribose 2'-O-methyltransferase Hen1
VHAVEHPLDERFPEWGESRYFTVELEGGVRLRDLLAHLYVLVPVLDAGKHYWVGEDEVAKLLRRGEGWLGGHPERELIVGRYLRYQPSLTSEALARLLEDEDPDPDGEHEVRAAEEEAVEEPLRLNEKRIGAVVAALKASGATRVLDLGCGSGKLVRALMKEAAFEQIAGVDISHRALELAEARLKLERLAPRQRERVRLFNVRFDGLPAGTFRHRDHRFEWTRRELEDWAGEVAGRFGYGVRFLTVGPEDPEVGAPTQMAVFER